MMKRLLTVFFSAVLLAGLTACGSTAGSAVSGAASKTGEVISDAGRGAGELISRAGDKMESSRPRKAASTPRPSATPSPMPASSGSPLMERDDGEVRDENGFIGDEDYEEAHDAVEEFGEEYQNEGVEELTD